MLLLNITDNKVYRTHIVIAEHQAETLLIQAYEHILTKIPALVVVVVVVVEVVVVVVVVVGGVMVRRHSGAPVKQPLHPWSHSSQTEKSKQAYLLLSFELSNHVYAAHKLFW